MDYVHIVLAWTPFIAYVIVRGLMRVSNDKQVLETTEAACAVAAIGFFVCWLLDITRFVRNDATIAVCGFLVMSLLTGILWRFNVNHFTEDAD
ncbi:MAG: hypothetical protein H6797_02035 [Candidatus Nomurabacteria bacterium]|nr:MAG: hypothetical protein H6797_02035 [Candidatus Nomurabacteria bacterium]